MAELAVIEGGNSPQKGSKSWCLKVRKRARQLAQDLDTGYMELAQLLYEVYDTPMDNDPNKGPIFKSWGYDSFAQWADEDLNIQKRKAERLRAIWYTLEVVLVGLDPDLKKRIVSLGASKVRELIGVLELENAEGWVSIAEKSSYPVLRASISKAKAKRDADALAAQVAAKLAAEAETEAEAEAEDESEEDAEEPDMEAVGGRAHVPDAAPDFDEPAGRKSGPQPPNPAAPPEEPEDMSFEHFGLFPEQHLNVKLALRKASELSGSDKKSHNLDLICTDFLANNDIIPSNIVENRMRFMRRMEQVFVVKIIALDTGNDEVVYGAGTLSKLAKGS
jgi:hypothetical protein